MGVIAEATKWYMGSPERIYQSIITHMQYRTRRISLVIAIVLSAVVWLALQYHPSPSTPASQPTTQQVARGAGAAQDALDALPVKGRAPKTGYARTQFGDGWTTIKGCDTRNIILNRDMKDVVVDESCRVTKGTLDDPYTGKTINFVRGTNTSDDVQIDHVVALSNSWQTGAQALTQARRIAMANDPLELLAVDGPMNQAKGDGDAATWLPPNKAFRCQYVARQIAVKTKYSLWVTAAEKQAIDQILATCPGQQLPVAS